MQTATPVCILPHKLPSPIEQKYYSELDEGLHMQALIDILQVLLLLLGIEKLLFEARLRIFFVAQKLYIDGLRFIVTKSHRYATRYQPQLETNLTDPQYTALLSFVSCCAALLAELGKNVITP